MRTLMLAAAAALALLAAGCGSTAPTTGSTSRGACSLVVNITATAGTVWGTVQVEDGGHTQNVSAQTQKVSLPCNSVATLTQTPSDAGTWPFAGWKVGNATQKQSVLTLKVKGTTHVAAVYVLGASSSVQNLSRPPAAASVSTSPSPSTAAASGSSSGPGW